MILALTADGTVPDVPPGHEVCALDHEWYVRFGTDSWDDEFVADSREEARAECWRRFCADEPEWSELLVRLLGADPVLRAARTIVGHFVRNEDWPCGLLGSLYAAESKPIPYSDEAPAMLADAFAKVEAQQTTEQREARDRALAGMTTEQWDAFAAAAVRPARPEDLLPPEVVAPERTPRQVLLDTLETNRREVALWPASLRNAISFNGLFDLPPDE